MSKNKIIIDRLRDAYDWVRHFRKEQHGGFECGGRSCPIGECVDAAEFLRDVKKLVGTHRKPVTK